MQIITGKLIKPQKVVVYGPEGIGKSTFASQFSGPLFIDTEDSTAKLDVARFPKPSSWTMLLAQVDYVKKNRCVCKTLVVDTADWAERLCAEHICAKAGLNGIEDFGWGKGYTYLEEEFGRLLNSLQEIIEIGINVVVTAHAEMKKIEQPEEIGGYDHWQLKLEKKTAPLLKEWADILLFANYKTIVVNVDNQGAQKGKNKAQGGKRVMYTSHSPWWDAKNRDGLDPELPFEYKAISHCIPDLGAPAAPITATQSTPPTSIPTYWHQQESRVVFEAKPGEPAPADYMDCVQISGEEYEKLSKEYKAAPVESSSVPPPEAKAENLSGLPAALAELMSENQVTYEEIQKVVAAKGYYPGDTPIENYDLQFINGVLVAAWQQVYQMIKNMRS